jgi:mRNA export factor
LQQVQSPLKYQTRCVCVMTDKLGYAIGSIEGRVGIQYFQDYQGGKDKKSFAFKCHREQQDVYAVNSIAFHPVYGTFATAGADGAFHFWDKNNKRRVAQFKKGPLPITSGVFNRDGSIYAYAYSYDWSKGAEYYKQGEGSQILLHHVPDKEIRPKTRN